MNIIKELNIAYHMKMLEAGSNVIDTIEDMDELSSHLKKNKKSVNNIQKKFKDNFDLKLEVERNPVYNNQLRIILNKTLFVEAFTEQNFEEAFNLSFSLLNTGLNNVEKAFFCSAAIDALGQIKTQYLNKDAWVEYNRRFYSVEEYLYKKGEELSPPTLTDDSLHALVSYNGTRMGLAYLAYLSSDMPKTEGYIQDQLNTYDTQTIMNHEITPPNNWLIQSVDQEKLKEFNALITKHLNPTPKRKNKMS